MLKTAETRLASSSRAHRKVLEGNCQSVATVCRIPTRFNPPIRTRSNGKPSAGTRRASSPRSVPTKIASWPRCRSSRATASAGITWPPVPPPAMRKTLADMLRNVHQNAQGNQGAQQRTAAGTDHRQRNTLGGHNPQHHADVNERLDHDHGGDPQRQIAPEVVRHEHRGPQAAPEDDQEGE